MEQDSIEKEKFVQQQVQTISQMQTGLNKLVDYCQVLYFVATQADKIQNMGAEGNADMEGQGQAPLLSTRGGVQIQFVAGTIKDEETMKLAKMLFRVTRGKALTHFSEPYMQDNVQRCVYMVVY